MFYHSFKTPFCFYRLMFDPYARIIYDYMGGIEDIKKAKVCVMVVPLVSLEIRLDVHFFNLLLL